MLTQQHSLAWRFPTTHHCQYPVIKDLTPPTHQLIILALMQCKVILRIYVCLEHGVTKYANLIGPLRESISLRITPFST